MKTKEEFYKYGESLGIKINDLQRLKMLADACNDKKYTEEDMLKAIEKARDIFDGKDCFTAEDVSGCTEVCTYNWKFQFSEDDIINSLNKQD